MRALASKFIPVADEVHRLQSGSGPECELFQKIAEQGHYAGRTQPTNTRQGTYAATVTGVFLGSINSNDPAQMVKMLEAALAKWASLSSDQRRRTEAQAALLPGGSRWEQRRPEDGLVLRVNSRDLPRKEAPSPTATAGKQDWRPAAWNQDYAWFRKEEARQFLPENAAPGATRAVPDPLVRRLARFHLIDNVRGQTTPFEDRDVEKASLSSTVLKRQGDLVSLRIEGETRTAGSGTWPVRGYQDMNSPTPQKRGYDARLRGSATYDLQAMRFTFFELTAVGARRGGTQYNGRGDDLDPAPMGIAFTLAGDSPSERVAPAFVWGYGWK